MATPLFDFSHLSAAERIELADDGDPGEPWQRVIDEIDERGG